MIKKFLLNFLLIFSLYIVNAQSITFQSEKTNQPLTKVSVFDKDGNILATSDIDGKIEKSAITENQENFSLVYDNFAIATLSYEELNKDIVKLNDRVRDIEQVVIKNQKPAKYIMLKGNFNAYVTLNGKLNCYTDGIVTYVFDNKTKKLKSTAVQQYRTYRLEDAKNEKKQTGSWDYNSFLDLPQLKNVGNIDEYKYRKATIKELRGSTRDEIEISGTTLQEKELAFFGYRLYDIRKIINHAYEKNTKKMLRDFLESNEVTFIKLKHKTEPDYNQIIVYENFYPTELDYSDDKKFEDEVKFNTNNSNYTTKYWESADFPNMQQIFSSFFKEDLKEKENKK